MESDPEDEYNESVAWDEFPNQRSKTEFLKKKTGQGFELFGQWFYEEVFEVTRPRPRLREKRQRRKQRGEEP